jgi:hypothetical protein
VRRIGVIAGANVPAMQALYAAFFQALQQLGWTEGRNVHIDVRLSAGNAAETRRSGYGSGLWRISRRPLAETMRRIDLATLRRDEPALTSRHTLQIKCSSNDGERVQATWRSLLSD